MPTWPALKPRGDPSNTEQRGNPADPDSRVLTSRTCDLSKTGYRPTVLELLEPCAFAPCERSTAATVRLVVEGEDLVLPVCDAHTQWLAGFAEADDASRVIDLVQTNKDAPRSDGEGPGRAGP